MTIFSLKLFNSFSSFSLKFHFSNQGASLSSRRSPCFSSVQLSRVCDPLDCSPPGSSVHGIVQVRILEGVGHSLLQGIFPTQGLNQELLHCRQILYHLSHQGSPKFHAILSEPDSGSGSDLLELLASCCFSSLQLGVCRRLLQPRSSQGCGLGSHPRS